jgi:hypothetical protein
LLLESKVSFETKYLKNFLSKRGGALAIRSAISRQRHRFEYFNHPPIDLNKMTTKLLRRFDVVIVDGQTLNELSEMEQKALRAAVEQEGLKMLIFPDDAILKNEWQNHNFFPRFRFERFAELDERLIKPSWPNLPEEVTAIPAAPLVLQDDFGMMPLIKDEMERTLAAAYQHGHGVVGLSLLRRTYRWILEGNAPFHAAYWSYVLSTLARHNQRKGRWILPTTKPAIVDRPLELAVATNAATPVGLINTERSMNVASRRQSGKPDSIYLRQDLNEPRRWFGTFWPRQAGWHRVSLIGGESHWFYVYEKENWPTWQAAQKIAATQRRAWQHKTFVSSARTRTHTSAKAIPLIWFFMLFILSCAYLWLERKF